MLLDARDDAHRLYSTIIECLHDGCIIANAFLTETRAGIASAAGARWDTAEQHFETALRQARDIPLIIEQPETRRWYAWMLLDRDAPGDKDKARTLLGEAIELHRTIGMPKHVGGRGENGSAVEGLQARRGDRFFSGPEGPCY